MSDDKPCIDAVSVLLEPGERSPVDKSTAAGLVGLVYLARDAFEEKRRRQCLEMTDAILKIEPGHTEARTIQASVRGELEKDYADAQALARDARSINDRVLYARAETALRRIVDADPDNLEAQSVLLETVAAGFFSSPSRTAQSVRRIKRHSILVGSVACVVLFVVLAFRNGTGAQGSAPSPNSPTISTNAKPVSDADSLVQLNAPETVVAPVNPAASAKPVRVDITTAPAKTDGADIAAPPDAAATSAMGALAVSAAVPVDIYRGEEHLGSTPTTLQLPAGPQVLEYRYQGLHQTVTHVIRSQQTITAAISFPIKVQINANPWAQVFLDGAPLRPIGQTPLGDVSLPIGSVLVFQNPSFPDKRYRVSARDAAIQVTFP